MLMNQTPIKIVVLLFLLILSGNFLHPQDDSKIDPWKIDLQILLGFSDDKVDGVMGQKTFEALKIFAKNHDLTDVVLRGDFDDL